MNDIQRSNDIHRNKGYPRGGSANNNAPRVTDKFHRGVYRAMIACAVIFVAAAWLFFGHSHYDHLDLTMVSVLFIVAIGVPLILSRVGHNDPSRMAEKDQAATEPRDDSEPPDDRSFADWLRGDFEDWQSRARAKNVLVEALLPLAAGAVGMTAIGLVFFFVSHAVGSA